MPLRPATACLRRAHLRPSLRRLADAEATKWYQRAQLALERGEDDLAREALTRRQQQTEMADNLKEQIETQEGSIKCARRGASPAGGLQVARQVGVQLLLVSCCSLQLREV